MLRRFLHGLAFGAGFGLAMGAIIFIAPYVQVRTQNSSPAVETTSVSPGTTQSSTRAEKFPPFHEGTIQERVEIATAITLAQYEKAPNGEMQAIITEILKAPTNFQYSVGDEHVSGRYLPEAGQSRGDKLIVFFVGSPPRFAQSFSVYGDRIPGAGDMELQGFLELVRASGT